MQPQKIIFSKYNSVEKCILQSLNEYSNNDVDRVYMICNESLVSQQFPEYNFVYPIEAAEKFLNDMKICWQNQSFFAFAIRDYKGLLHGCCYIRENLNDAEIGYWMSKYYPGAMSNAICELVNLAKKSGYKKLYAVMKVDNLKSIKVMHNNNFIEDKVFEDNGEKMIKFIKII